MVHYLYHFDYDIQQLQRDRLSSGLETDKERTIVNGRITDVLVTHAEVYALAEKYMIRGLKAVALRHFKIAAAAHFVDISDFLQAACEVYTSTVEHDRGLRDVVVETLHSRSNWLVKDEVRDLLNDLGDLAYDLVRYRHQN
ncbi:hypothetical protein QBC42DRAFT_13077 [Cladorrhinum samala]|uniref:Uncharacterized protein n=1 Tax=Cladorrhinum samala TaxID=585594 RepID=A0AAV9HZW3_9PEZI|nr:hypothetical protein QBC42DRAFT_13077 [Cladorrhinum samala]